MLRVTCEYGVRNNHIFGIPNPNLPVHYTTMTIKGSLLMKISYRRFLIEKCLVLAKFLLWRIFGGLNINFDFLTSVTVIKMYQHLFHLFHFPYRISFAVLLFVNFLFLHQLINFPCYQSKEIYSGGQNVLLVVDVKNI